MAIATGTAIGLAAASQLGGSLIGAKMQSNASKKAAAAQEQATRQSSAYIQQGLGQLGPMYAPYINAGTGAIGTLGRLTTPGPGARFASPGPPNVMPQIGGGPPPTMPRNAMQTLPYYPSQGPPPTMQPLPYYPNQGQGPMLQPLSAFYGGGGPIGQLAR